MIFDLKVNGKKDGEKIPVCGMTFSWECEGETQFTVQMSPDEGFLKTAMYLDTRDRYCVYDGFPLKKGKTYYWRIRSGLKEWTEAKFTTEE